MFDVNVQSASISDLPAILEISNHYARTTPANFAVEPETIESWEESFRATHEKYPWFVAAERRGTGDVKHQEVIGFAKASPWKGRCAYHWSAEVTVYLRHDRLGRGIGRLLYAKLIDMLREQGFHSIVGGITLPNHASVRLHESFGFRKVAHFERIGFKFGAWHDVGYWEMHLQDGDAPPNSIRPVRDVLNDSSHD